MTKDSNSFRELDQQIPRLLYNFQASMSAPTLIIIAGIHGNEPAGIHGLNRVIETIRKKTISLKGNFYAIAGNINALKKNIRFEQSDLNRLWTQDSLAQLEENNDNPDRNEQNEIHQAIRQILSDNEGPFYFIDLHTTSANSIPFITISDSLNNRKFASNFSFPVILGIEEFLEGPLLTYINEFGHVSLGFEAGQHEDPASVENCVSFIWKALVISGCLSKKDLYDIKIEDRNVDKDGEKLRFYEVKYRYLLANGDDFLMAKNYTNFDRIKKGELLAFNNERTIPAPIRGRIFMPLYQRQGKDGFFIIHRISIFWIQLSKFLRQLKLQNLLRLLPGIKQDKESKYILIVSPKTVRFLATEIFHLFGYRKKLSKNNMLYFIRRDRKISEYR